jgi:hypothetical protein
MSWPKEEVQADMDTYFKSMMNGNIDKCCSIEDKYDLYGYPPEIVSVGLNAAFEGTCIYEAVDKYLLGEE